LAMAKRKTKYNLLLVCEGENTEPNYFQRIKEQVLSENIWTEGVAITISPKPNLDDADSIVPQKSKHKTKRKQRTLLTVENEGIVAIEKQYAAVPVRYVREAQQGLEDNTFDEVWAVFDKDGHPKQQEAYQLAGKEIEGKRVNIAFSSISFEHWILLHFERNKTAFVKSKNVIEHLEKRNFLKQYSKKTTANFYKQIENKTHFAIKNAAWLRHQQKNNTLPIWEQNPYTDIDFLVKRLLKIDKNIVWTTYDEALKMDNLTTLFSKNGDFLKIEIENHQKSSFILNHSKLKFESEQEINLSLIFNSEIIETKGFVEFDIAVFKNKDAILAFDISTTNTIMIVL
jgi:hypothetical protein